MRNDHETREDEPHQVEVIASVGRFQHGQNRTPPVDQDIDAKAALLFRTIKIVLLGVAAGNTR
jgi:hypothetical protein